MIVVPRSTFEKFVSDVQFWNVPVPNDVSVVPVNVVNDVLFINTLFPRDVMAGGKEITTNPHRANVLSG